MYMVIKIKKLDQYFEGKRQTAGEKEQYNGIYVYF